MRVGPDAGGVRFVIAVTLAVAVSLGLYALAAWGLVGLVRGL